MTQFRAAFVLAAAASAFLGAVAPAHAQFMDNSNSTYVGGNADVKADSLLQAAIAIGDNSTARADQGVVYEGSYVKGDIKMDCKSKVQAAIAIGNGSHASASQCTLGQPKR